MQDLSLDANSQPMRPAELAQKQETARKAGKVFPYDEETVFASAALKDTHSLNEPMTVHPEQAKKLIAAGKASKTADNKPAEVVASATLFDPKAADTLKTAQAALEAEREQLKKDKAAFETERQKLASAPKQ